MYQNGWRPVPAERHDGIFMPIGQRGPIRRDGMVLEERPIQLTKEAQEEDIAIARAQMRDRDNSLMGGKAGLRNAMPQGSMDSRYRGAGGRLQMSIDPGLDVPEPGGYAPPDDSTP